MFSSRNALSRRFTWSFATCAAIAGLAGCGGGGDAPSAAPNAAPEFLGSPTLDISEGEASITVNVADADGDALTITIQGGADAARFSIDSATKSIKPTGGLDFERPADDNADNSYLITVSVSDGRATATRTFTIRVLNVVEPFFAERGAVAITPDATLTHRDQLGYAIAAAGDVDGDSKADVVIGAPANRISWLGAGGSAYLVTGKRLSSVMTGIVNLSGVGQGDALRVDGPTAPQLTNDLAAGRLGASAFGVPDLDGDGRPELYVADPDADFFAGKSYVMFSQFSRQNLAGSGVVDIASSTGAPRVASLLEIANISSSGFGSNGEGATLVGDMDGDGLAELFIPAADGWAPAPERPPAREYFVVFGDAVRNAATTGGRLELRALVQQRGAVRILQDQGGWGTEVGDVNGDGRADLLVSGIVSDQPRYLVSGQAVAAARAASGLIDLSFIPSSGVYATFSGVPGIAGVSGIAGAGDVDNDGFADLILGDASATAGGKTSAGQTYIFFGSPGVFTAPQNTYSLADLLPNRLAARIDGVESNIFAGFNVGAILNSGSKRPAFVMVAGLGGTGIYGFKPSDLARGAAIDLSRAVFRVKQIDSGDGFAARLASAGDIDGDGFGDLLISATTDPEPVNQSVFAGEVYIVSGAKLDFESRRNGVVDLGQLFPTLKN